MKHFIFEQYFKKRKQSFKKKYNIYIYTYKTGNTKCTTTVPFFSQKKPTKKPWSPLRARHRAPFRKVPGRAESRVVPRRVIHEWNEYLPMDPRIRC